MIGAIRKTEKGGSEWPLRPTKSGGKTSVLVIFGDPNAFVRVALLGTDDPLGESDEGMREISVHLGIFSERSWHS